MRTGTRIAGTSAILLSLFMLSITGCESLFKVKSEAKPTVQSQRIENQDAVIDLLYLDEATLVQLYGKRDNPFLPPPAIITPYTFYVFSMTVNAKADIYIPISSILMRMAGKNFRSATHESLTAFWQQVEEDYATSERKPDTSKYNELIRRHLIPGELLMDAGETYSGYIVFLGSIPSSGELKVTVPVVSRAEDVAEKLDILFQFE